VALTALIFMFWGQPAAVIVIVIAVLLWFSGGSLLMRSWWAPRQSVYRNNLTRLR
jgi:hypothetical protein